MQVLLVALMQTPLLEAPQVAPGELHTGKHVALPVPTVAQMYFCGQK